MRRWFLIAGAIILNSIGHSMTIVTNMGSMPWPASIVNIMHTMGWTMTETIFTEGTVVILLNALIARRWDWRGILKEFGFLLPYSILMQWFAGWWRFFGIDRLMIWWRLGFDLLGLTTAFVGLAIYQSCQFCHPHDDLSVTLKHHFNGRFMQDFNMILPIIIVVLCGLHNQVVFAVNIGTVVGLFWQSRVVTFCDQYVLGQIK
ncbi:sugar permease [Limosilactobacillus caecicola]|uniref:sugar permease n=1 Tax=Limosilactobacillus caecicola TaxID=2941332 RepID=UPI00203EA4A6|nr:sugar permease [Limosilactobacillus caecicola]